MLPAQRRPVGRGSRPRHGERQTSKHFYPRHAKRKRWTRKSKAIEDLRRGLPIITERQTVSQFLDAWLLQIRPTVRPLTYVQYSQHVRRYLKPELGRHQLPKLSPQMVQGFVTAMLKKPASTKRRASTPGEVCTLSPRTVQLSLVILRHALDGSSTSATTRGATRRSGPKTFRWPRRRDASMSSRGSSISVCPSTI